MVTQLIAPGVTSPNLLACLCIACCTMLRFPGGISETQRAQSGVAALFDRQAVAMIRHELNAMDARRVLRRSQKRSEARR